MVFRYNKLRGRIVEKFGTLSNFALNLSAFKQKNIAVQVVSAKLNSKIGFTIDDVSEWCTLLEIPVAEIGSYFFDYELSKDESERLKTVGI